MHENLFPSEDFLKLMVETHPLRFNQDFWRIFDEYILKKLPQNPEIVDLGTGPGLFLKDLDRKVKRAKFYGYDSSTTMIEYAKRLEFSKENEASFFCEDVSTPLRFPDADLISANFLLHGIEYPVPLLKSILESLRKKSGFFLIYDWVRTPIEVYFDYLDTLPHPMGEKEKYSLFPFHNKYGIDDLKWLLRSTGFKVLHLEKVNRCHQVIISTP